MARMAGDEIRDKFGLKYNEKHAEKGAPGKWSKSTGGDGYATKDGAIFTESGEYVGSVKGDGDADYYAGFSDLTDAASSIKKEHEGKGFSNVNSLSDVAGAVHWLTKGDGEEAPEEKAFEGITYSEPVAKAKAGKAAFEKTILPREGDYIMGRKKTNPADDYLASYKLQLEEYRKPRNKDGSLYDPEEEAAKVAGVTE